MGDQGGDFFLPRWDIHRITSPKATPASGQITALDVRTEKLLERRKLSSVNRSPTGTPQLATPNAAAAPGVRDAQIVSGRRLGAEHLARDGAQRDARHETNENREEKRPEVARGAARQRGNRVQERERRARNGGKHPDRHGGETHFRFQLQENLRHGHPHKF